MEAYIKYQRFVKEFNTDEEIQKFLDELSAGGWDIISYKEDKRKELSVVNPEIIIITIMAGKRQNNIL